MKLVVFKNNTSEGFEMTCNFLPIFFIIAVFCTKMKKIVSLSVLFLLLVVSLYAEQNILSISGKGGIPYFDSLGRLHVAYIDAYGRLSLSTIQETTGTVDQISTQNLLSRDNVQSIRVKEDRIGRHWIIWEENFSGKNDIYIAQLINGGLLHPLNLSSDQKGHNLSPHIELSLDNELWAAWVNYFQKNYTIIVKNVAANQAWAINSPQGPSALSPHIIIDGTGKIWLFWVGKLRNRDEILYSQFDGQSWREPLSLNLNPDVPHLSPSISLDLNGYPHVVWSAYDGEDYEIYYSSWDGYKWSLETNITHNQNISDASPSISLFLDRIPIVAWLRSFKGTREICFAFKQNEVWSPEIRISAGIDILGPPKLVSSEEKIGILWQDRTGIKIQLEHFLRWQGTSNSKHLEVDSPRVFPKNFARILGLDRDKYVGFGDSITYGIIALAPAPNLGYVPRLEDLIDSNIKNSDVVNQGIGGEKTGEGLARINSVVNGEQAQTIFLMEGTNDVKDTSISMDTAAFNLQAMIDRCLNLGMTTFLGTILPHHPWEGLTEARVRDLNQKIESIAADPNIYFVDQFSSFTNHSIPWPALLSDTTHPTADGYQIIAETWYKDLVDTLGQIELDETSLSFEAGLGGSNPANQSFRVRNSGSGRLNYQISVDKPWLSVSPSGGDSTGQWDEIQVSVDISNLAAGTYQGHIEVTADYAPNSPQMISVELTILNPTIGVDKTSLSFEADLGGSNPPNQTLKVRNSGSGKLDYEITVDQQWLSVSPSSGDSSGEWDDVQVSVDISNLAQGTYQGNITISADNASDGSQDVTVQLTIHGPAIGVDKTSLSFDGVVGEPNPASQSFRVRNSGADRLNYEITVDQQWLSVSPSSGDSSGEWDEIQVSVDISNLTEGTYQGNITVSTDDTANGTQVLTVRLTIRNPTIGMDRTALSFEATAGEANPAPQTFRVRNSGAGTLHYQISTDQVWIKISPLSGDSTGEWDEIQVSVDISNLIEENHQGSLTISAQNASNNPQTLTVNLTIHLPPIFPPLNFNGEKKENKSVSLREYINILRWQANSQNTIVESYKVYLIEGEERILLTEVDKNTFEYWQRGVEKDKVYRYGLTAKDKFGKESEVVFIEIR